MTLDIGMKLEKTVITFDDVHANLTVAANEYVCDLGISVFHGSC